MDDSSVKDTIQLYSEKELNIIARMSTSTAMALSTDFSLERKMLNVLEEDSLLQLDMRVSGNLDLRFFNWMEIKQVGMSADGDFDTCFTALQNILRAFQLPHTRLTFLITGEDRYFRLYMGLYSKQDKSNNKRQDAISELSSFCNVSWPGLKTNVVKSVSGTGIESFSQGKFDKVYAITGIPSMDLEKTKYPSTLEYLLGGCKPKGKIAYLVVAEPIDETEINNIIYSCNEMSGQAESFKSFSITNSIQKGTTDTITESITNAVSKSSTKGTSRRDTAAAVVTSLVGIGLTLGAVAFPPIGAIAALGGGAAGMIGAASVMGLLNSLIPQKSSSETVTKQESKSSSTAHGLSESYSMSLTSTVVNGHVNSVIELLMSHRNRFVMGKAKGMWQVGCYLFTDQDNSTSHIQLKSILSGYQSRLEPIRVHDITSLLRSGENESSMQRQISPFVTPPKICVVDRKNLAIFEHPFGNRFSYLATCLTTDELMSMVNFPLHPLPGISVVDVIPDFSLSPQNLSSNGPVLEMGSLMYSGTQSSINVGIPMDALNRHSLVCGVNGSGKTNTVIKVLNGLMKESRPFLVIEPAKTEYVDWALEYNKCISDDSKKIKIFMPGCESYAKGSFVPNKLKLNPFEVIGMEGADSHLLMHIDRLKVSLASAFPMQDVIPVIMERLIYELYISKGMITQDGEIKTGGKGFPTFWGVNEPFMDKLMTQLGYARENTQNISAALRTRIHTMKQGWKKELLCNERLAEITWEELFGSPVIINLSYAGDDQDKAFIMSMLLQFLYEYRIAESEAGKASFSDNVCRHLVVVEEAHRVMMKNDNPESTQFKAGMMISNFLSEVRAYGQGMMIVDQIPTRLIDDAIKNTNIKIIHRTVAADDASALADSIGLSDNQRKVISRLAVGQAVLSGLNNANVNASNYADIYLAQITKTK